MSARQVVLDTETTGLDPAAGHRVIEIGAIELVNRRPTGKRFHRYLNPERAIDEGAIEVHGITDAFLADKPRFADVAEEFVAFVRDAELVIHNAPFDVGFLDAELARLGPGWGRIAALCGVCDTLQMARAKHPGQKNSLDALCRRYEVDNSHRELHGALLDAEILADVYLAMTGGQVTLSLEGRGEGAADGDSAEFPPLDPDRPPLPVLRASAGELEAHAARLAAIDEASGGRCLWRQLEPSGEVD
ncbi:MAG: DNA polymerase III subunit epsilon [Gammaproteobacteria bacterium]|nr:DNA polymerase III subunit epsilon [Gammaproteobacteria bacterium]